ncbi:MAG TPA: STAS domain-containing protein [Bryobacteraceae bacterium]|nr:STAS domain-containing protein [Bryobacteraceae bacterium]
MAQSFAVARSREGDISLLALQGYLDAHTAPQFEKAIEEEIQGGRYRIVVNCAGLTYISSAGLGVFMSFIEDVRAANGDIKICSVTDNVYQVFEILGFPTLFDILADQPAALQRFAEAPTRES